VGDHTKTPTWQRLRRRFITKIPAKLRSWNLYIYGSVLQRLRWRLITNVAHKTRYKVTSEIKGRQSHYSPPKKNIHSKMRSTHIYSNFYLVIVHLNSKDTCEVQGLAPVHVRLALDPVGWRAMLPQSLNCRLWYTCLCRPLIHKHTQVYTRARAQAPSHIHARTPDSRTNTTYTWTHARTHPPPPPPSLPSH